MDDKNQPARPHIICRKASARLGGREFFQELDWTIAKKEHWTLLGSNGSGKSLLAGLIGRKVPLDKGEIAYFFRIPRRRNHRGNPFFSRAL